MSHDQARRIGTGPQHDDLGAGGLDHLGHQQPNRAGAGDNDRLPRFHMSAFQGMDTAGQRFTQRAGNQVNIGGQKVDIVGRHQDILGKAAMHPATNRFALWAQVGQTGATEVTFVADREIGLTRDAIPHLTIGHAFANVRHQPGHFMPHDDRRIGGILAVIDMNIGATDPGSFDFNQNMVGPDFRHRDFQQPHMTVAWRQFGNTFHGSSPVESIQQAYCV